MSNQDIRNLMTGDPGPLGKPLADGLLYGILESAPDAILVMNGKGGIVVSNGQAGRMFGYTPEEMVGKSVESLMPKRFRTQHVDHRRHYDPSGPCD